MENIQILGGGYFNRVYQTKKVNADETKEEVRTESTQNFLLLREMFCLLLFLHKNSPSSSSSVLETNEVYSGNDKYTNNDFA
jgi:hypothetical protein